MVSVFIYQSINLIDAISLTIPLGYRWKMSLKLFSFVWVHTLVPDFQKPSKAPIYETHLSVRSE